jgi:VCBS repeat-containing protein
LDATLEGVNVSVTFKITGFFEDSSILVPTNVNVTIGDGPELIYEIQARILSDTDGDGDMEPVQGPNGLFTGTVTLDISGNEVHASYSGQAQPGDFTISIAHLTPAGDPFAPGTFISQGGFSGVNTLFPPTYDPSTATLTLHWGFLGFQPGTSVNQTVFYDNELADAPVAGDDAYHVFVGSSLSGANVLDNDTDLDNANSIGVVDPSSVLSVNGASGNVGQWIDLAAGGRIRLNSDGSLSFDDDGDFSDLGGGETRDVTFSYTVTDTTNLTDDAQVTITVEGVNFAPVAGDERPLRTRRSRSRCSATTATSIAARC